VVLLDNVVEVLRLLQFNIKAVRGMSFGAKERWQPSLSSDGQNQWKSHRSLLQFLALRLAGSCSRAQVTWLDAQITRR
jgi:hypothetical protein